MAKLSEYVGSRITWLTVFGGAAVGGLYFQVPAGRVGASIACLSLVFFGLASFLWPKDLTGPFNPFTLESHTAAGPAWLWKTFVSVAALLLLSGIGLDAVGV